METRGAVLETQGAGLETQGAGLGINPPLGPDELLGPHHIVVFVLLLTLKDDDGVNI